MAIVVTGAAGFIGSHLVETLAARGEQVIAVDRRAGAPRAAAATVVADLADPTQVEPIRDAFRAADAVFHLAGCPGVRSAEPDIELRRTRDNVLAGAHVLRVAPAAVPVVVVSSSSVYGGAVHDGRLRPSREGDRLHPRGGYARSKAALEALAADRAARGGRVAVARPFTVAGERQRPDMALARWLSDVRAGRPIRILGSPRRTRDVTDVRDVVEGLIRMAERDVSGAVNLGTGVGHTLADLAAAVCSALGAPADRVVAPAAHEEAPATLADTTRCRRLLGFVPRTDLAALVRRQAALPAAEESALAPVPA